MIGAMDVNVTTEGVVVTAEIDPILQPSEGEDPGEDQVTLIEPTIPHLASRHTPHEEDTDRCTISDPAIHPVPSNWSQIGSNGCTDSGRGSRDQPLGGHLRVFDETEPLLFHIDHHQPLRRVGRAFGLFNPSPANPISNETLSASTTPATSGLFQLLGQWHD